MPWNDIQANSCTSKGSVSEQRPKRGRVRCRPTSGISRREPSWPHNYNSEPSPRSIQSWNYINVFQLKIRAPWSTSLMTWSVLLIPAEWRGLFTVINSLTNFEHRARTELYILQPSLEPGNHDSRMCLPWNWTNGDILGRHTSDFEIGLPYMGEKFA
jgi:hypothetical protein